MQHKKLSKPPLKDAIFEVLVDISSNIRIEDIDNFTAIIQDEFPDKNNIYEVEAVLPVDAEVNADFKRNIIGYVHSNADKTILIQTRKNGFSINQTQFTYSKWEDFKPLALKWFFKYADYLNVSKAQRISLRFINQIEFPLPIQNLRELIFTMPDMPDEVGTQIISTFTRLEFLNPSFEAQAILIEYFLPPTSNTLQFVFDIDVIKQLTSDTSEIDYSYFEQEFDKLRDFKTAYFLEVLVQPQNSILHKHQLYGTSLNKSRILRQ